MFAQIYALKADKFQPTHSCSPKFLPISKRFFYVCGKADVVFFQAPVEALGYWDNKSEEKILRTTTDDDGPTNKKWHDFKLCFLPIFDILFFGEKNLFFLEICFPNILLWVWCIFLVKITTCFLCMFWRKTIVSWSLSLLSTRNICFQNVFTPKFYTNFTIFLRSQLPHDLFHVSKKEKVFWGSF